MEFTLYPDYSGPACDWCRTHFGETYGGDTNPKWKWELSYPNGQTAIKITIHDEKDAAFFKLSFDKDAY